MKFYYVYIPHSIADAGRYYVGMTSDLETRLKMHNTGKCTHTAKDL
ncbi:MAG: GIY-YIG nuclease family protein [Planctomycetes bacterium]|nr:GIY-YIG nuclease family protein [Planctomycetota bacterium]MCH8120418.1 GIY-YIG nuclease family protein [Planctomycetota bacterium]